MYDNYDIVCFDDIVYDTEHIEYIVYETSMKHIVTILHTMSYVRLATGRYDIVDLTRYHTSHIDILRHDDIAYDIVHVS